VPKAQERALKKVAKKKFGSTKSPRARAFIYGIMRKSGWKPKRRKTTHATRRAAPRKKKKR
jgi:hypothetical protein